MGTVDSECREFEYHFSVAFGKFFNFPESSSPHPQNESHNTSSQSGQEQQMKVYIQY